MYDYDEMVDSAYKFLLLELIDDDTYKDIIDGLDDYVREGGIRF